jgi:hypothetical protein
VQSALVNWRSNSVRLWETALSDKSLKVRTTWGEFGLAKEGLSGHVSSWLRAGELSDDYQDYYYFLATLGRKVELLAARLLRLAVAQIVAWGHLLLAIDDTPSKRYGPKVEGAGVHHNPTPGPAGAKFLYGHNWVTLAWALAPGVVFDFIAILLRQKAW